MVRNRRANRGGLAPLEFVLVLPILLGAMFLMISFGVLGAWKIRGLCVARSAAWEHRNNHNLAAEVDLWKQVLTPGSTSPNPGGPSPWAAGAGPQSFGGSGLGWGSATDATTLDSISGPQYRALRGPQLGLIAVNPYLFNPNRGFLSGTASLTRDFAAMRWQLGAFNFTAHTALLDDLWRFEDMGQRDYHYYGLSQNAAFRSPIGFPSGPGGDLVAFYGFSAATDPASEQSFNTRIKQQYYALSTAVNGDLAVLDRDEELRTLSGMVPDAGYARDFHPKIGRFCSGDDVQVQALVDSVCQRIDQLDDTVADYFARTYRTVATYLEDQMKVDPSLNYQATIDDLRRKADILSGSSS